MSDTVTSASYSNTISAASASVASSDARYAFNDCTTTKIDYEKFGNHVSNMANKGAVQTVYESYMSVNKGGVSVSVYPVPKLIKQRGDKVIVTWMDDTYTVVVREKDTPDNLYLAFCAAFAKKMFGTTGKVIKAFDNADEREIKRKEAERLAEEAAKKAEEEKLLQEKDQAEYEEAVKERMRLLSIELEALHRLEQEEAAKREAKQDSEE